MRNSESPVDETELHAFVDGRLPPDRRAAVEALLTADPDAAARVRAWQGHRAALRAIFADGAPGGARFDLYRMAEARLRARRAPPWRMAAAVALVAVGLGGAGGWYMRGLPPSRQSLALSLLEQEALTSYAVYAPDRRHPIEVAATERDHLAQWLSNRLSRKIAPPDLSAAGWRLLGGRLLATEHGGAAALFMYDNADGQRLSVVMRPMATDIEAPSPRSVPGRINASTWIDAGVGYAVVAPTAEGEISKVTKLVKGQAPT